MPMPYPGIYEFTAAARRPATESSARCSSTTIEDEAIDAMLDAIGRRALADGDDPAPRPRWRGGPRARGCDRVRPPRAPRSWWGSTTYMDPSTEAEQVAWTEGLHEAACRPFGRRLLELPRRRGRRAGSTRPTPGPPTRGWRTSSAATTRRICSAQPEHPPGRLTELTDGVPGRRSAPPAERPAGVFDSWRPGSARVVPGEWLRPLAARPAVGPWAAAGAARPGRDTSSPGRRRSPPARRSG